MSCCGTEIVLQPESLLCKLQQIVTCYSRRAVQRSNQCVRQPRLVCSFLQRAATTHHTTVAVVRPLAILLNERGSKTGLRLQHASFLPRFLRDGAQRRRCRVKTLCACKSCPSMYT